MKKWFSIFVLVINGLAMYTALVVAPTEEHLGELSRIFYVHVPPALVSYIAFGIAFIASLLFLARRSLIFDALAYSAVIVGITYISAALLLGAIWANVTWGVYWSWDPRETATLVLWLAYMGYFLLRTSIQGFEKKRVVSAVYAILSFLTVPMSYLSAVYWRTLHPLVLNGTASGFKLTQPIFETFALTFLATFCLYIYLQIILFKLELREHQLNGGNS